jgi:hypothetical protein
MGQLVIDFLLLFRRFQLLLLDLSFSPSTRRRSFHQVAAYSMLDGDMLASHKCGIDFRVHVDTKILIFNNLLVTLGNYSIYPLLEDISDNCVDYIC